MSDQQAYPHPGPTLLGMSMAGRPIYFSHVGATQGPVGEQQLVGLVQTQVITPTSMLCFADGAWFPASQLPGLYSQKSYLTALLLSIFIGGLGADRFYIGHTGLGVAKLLTLGGCGIWHLIDVILFATRKVRDSDGLPLGA